ncbi:hypothetical protein ACFQZW_12895 [Lutibacter aestuarii]|uniref:Uncharacterized protein n=1 Tax=Lutibacter aestuarii TaxID=861111 RepID=A0ABW2ZAK2_9FLAO
MKYPTITIESKNYNVAFNYSTIRALAELWNVEKPSEVEKRIVTVMNKAVPKKGKAASELNFKDIDVLEDLFFTAINTVNENFKYTSRELMTIILDTPEVIQNLTKHYINSLPKPVNDVVPNVQRDRKKK